MFKKDDNEKFEIRGQFTPENSALVLIDYQVGTLQLIRNVSSDVSLRNAVMLAKAAETLGMPNSADVEPRGPLYKVRLLQLYRKRLLTLTGRE